MRERMDVEHWRRIERSCYLYKNDAFLHRPAFLLIVLSLPVYVRVRVCAQMVRERERERKRKRERERGEERERERETSREGGVGVEFNDVI